MEHTFIIADKQDIVKLGLRFVIDITLPAGELAKVEEADSLSELNRLLYSTPDAIVILDHSSLYVESIEQIMGLVSRHQDARWIIFSKDINESFVQRLASGSNISILYKECDKHELRMAISQNVRQERYLCQRTTNMLLSGLSRNEDQHDRLTASEIEILKLIAQGKTVKEIAASRFSSVHTITTHKKNIFRKINVNSVYEATKYALRNGLVEMVEYYI